MFALGSVSGRCHTGWMVAMEITLNFYLYNNGSQRESPLLLQNKFKSNKIMLINGKNGIS